jgi:zinc protease
MSDFTVTTPEAMQALAKKYLNRGSSWRLAVLPQGRTLASLPGWAPGAVLSR